MFFKFGLASGTYFKSQKKKKHATDSLTYKSTQHFNSWVSVQGCTTSQYSTGTDTPRHTGPHAPRCYKQPHHNVGSTKGTGLD